MAGDSGMKKNPDSIEHLSQLDLSRLIMDFFHRIMMHHAMWFSEVQHQHGKEKALDVMGTVYEKSANIQLKRLSRTLGFEMGNGIPSPMLHMGREKLMELSRAVAANWLANDGVWFQTLEFSKGMPEAKKCNDMCWGQFSPFEAWSIKKFLNLSDKPGLDGLKKALHYRLYAAINKQSITDEKPDSFIFQMNECRVQTKRKQKGLNDYPCKSAGLIEYPTFAESIDSRIKTECVACPPDDHPEEWFCSWRFSIEK
jgi:hypothetical protein